LADHVIRKQKIDTLDGKRVKKPNKVKSYNKKGKESKQALRVFGFHVRQGDKEAA